MTRLVVRPFGYLAFVLALAALSVAAKALGEKDELGYFSARLAQTVWRYPEITRRGVQMAWIVWTAMVIVAASPLDPLSTPWDEVVLGAAGLAFLWRRLVGGRRAVR